MANILLYPNSVLGQVSGQVTKFDETLTKLFEEMEQAMRAEGGIGISAVQISVPIRAMIVAREDNTLLKICNPEIILDPEAPSKYLKEGCLSIPGLQVPIWRPEDVEIKFKDEKGEDHRSVLDGWTARCFLHEYDHFEGKTLFDHLANFKKSDALQKYNRARRKLGL
jgi:peptide deformylase